MFGLSKSEDPPLSFIRFEDMKMPEETMPDYLILNFYKIAHKDSIGSAKYGKDYYHLEKGELVFTVLLGNCFEKSKRKNCL